MKNGKINLIRLFDTLRYQKSTFPKGEGLKALNLEKIKKSQIFVTYAPRALPLR